jgi:hypothetical protein
VGTLGCVLGIVILLEDKVADSGFLVQKGGKKTIRENTNVVRINGIMDAAK